MNWIKGDREMVEATAIIKSARLEIGVGALLTTWLNLSYGDGGHQGFGGHCLYNPKFSKRREYNYAGHFIHRCLEVAGVSEWDKLPGRKIRVRKESQFGRIIEIGHIKDDDWFNPKKDFESWRIERIADKRILEKAIETFGFEKQIIKTLEELGGLSRELAKLLYEENLDELYFVSDDLIKELAGVKIMIRQVEKILGLDSTSELPDMIEYKIRKLRDCIGRSDT